MKRQLFLLLSFMSCVACAQDAGSALRFGGSSYVDVAHSATLAVNSSFTIEAWVRPSSLAGFPVVLEKGSATTSRIGLQIFNDGSMCGYFSPACNVSTAAGVVSVNEWSHVVYVFDDVANVNRLYCNGVLVGTSAEAGSPNALAGNLNVGRSVTLAARHWTGDLDEMKVWNRALGQTEIRHKMCQHLTGAEPGLVAYWRMDEGTDNTCSATADVCDQTGNGNHGTKF